MARLISESEENAFTTPPLSAIDSGQGNGIAVNGQVPSRKGNGHQRRATVDARTNEVEPPQVRIGLVPNGSEAENVAAGWPSWLASVAGEALKGWLPRKAESFERLNQIGQGTYSSVYKARDLETGKIVALKKVRFMNMDPESVRFMAREIHVLRRLDHPNIVKLEGLIASKTGCNVYLVFEYMEHDLAGLAATPGIMFSEPQVKCYMQQLLHGLDYCHSHGVLHRDIKGSNLLIDNNGILRIADFGLATFFNPDKKQQFTSRVVTLWYRPPELLLGATEYGVSVDLWSTGCILAELLAGKPIMPGRTEVEQLHKIFKLCGSPSDEYWRKSKLSHVAFKPQHPYRRCIHEAFMDFPSSAIALLDNLLSIEPENRGAAASALNSDFFNTKPFACDPSSLPKYPPSKEFDAKLRDEERRSRQQAAALRRNGPDSVRRNLRGSEGVPVANMDVTSKNRQAPSNHKSAHDKYNLLEDGGSVFPIVFSKGMTQNCSSWRKKVIDDENNQSSGQPIGTLRRLNGPQLKAQRSYVNHRAVDLTALSGLMVSRSSSKSDNHIGKSNRPHLPEQRSQNNRLAVAEASRKQEWTDRLLERPASSHRKDERTDSEEASSVCSTKKNRIHYSGPLMPPGGNLVEMLKEHERQIQQAVRKSRTDKAYTRKNYG